MGTNQESGNHPTGQKLGDMFLNHANWISNIELTLSDKSRLEIKGMSEDDVITLIVKQLLAEGVGQFPFTNCSINEVIDR